MIRKILLGLLAFVVLIVIAGLCWRAWEQHQIASDLRINLPNAIDEAKFINVNGAQQWITIRGENKDNPVILFLHGGPSEANSELARLYTPFEEDFVFVQWDQPGAGKTYIAAGDRQPQLTLDSMANDGVAVAESVRAELRKPNVILIGQDWGGVLGIRMIERQPNLFAAFVGTGQIVGAAASQEVQYQYALSHATANHDQKMLDALKEIGPPPYRSLDTNGRFQICCRNPFWPADDVAAVRRLQAMLLFSPSLSIAQMRGWVKGLRTGEQALDTMLMTMPDLRTTDTMFSVPVFFIQGENDNVTPTSPVADYVAKIQAPVKKLDVVPGAGHFVMWTHPDEFLRILHDDLRAATPTAN